MPGQRQVWGSDHFKFPAQSTLWEPPSNQVHKNGSKLNHRFKSPLSIVSSLKRIRTSKQQYFTKCLTRNYEKLKLKAGEYIKTNIQHCSCPTCLWEIVWVTHNSVDLLYSSIKVSTCACVSAKMLHKLSRREQSQFRQYILQTTLTTRTVKHNSRSRLVTTINDYKIQWKWLNLENYQGSKKQNKTPKPRLTQDRLSFVLL